MLKLKLQYFGHLMRRLTHGKRPWGWKRLKAGRKGDNRRWDGWMASPTQWTWVWVNSGSWWWTGIPYVLQSVGHKESDKTEWLKWIELNWTARRSNQSILKEINHKYSLKGLMLKLKPQYFIHPMGKSDSLERTLMLGKTEGRRKRYYREWKCWMPSLTQWT